MGLTPMRMTPSPGCKEVPKVTELLWWKVIDRVFVSLIVAAFIFLLISFGLFLRTGFDGSFQRYAQHMNW